MFVEEKGARAKYYAFAFALIALAAKHITLRQYHRKHYFAGNPSKVRVGRETKSNKFCSN